MYELPEPAVSLFSNCNPLISPTVELGLLILTVDILTYTSSPVMSPVPVI